MAKQQATETYLNISSKKSSRISTSIIIPIRKQQLVDRWILELGGIISLYAICEYPAVFGGAACMSTHWPLGLPGITDQDIKYDVPGAYIKYLEHHLPDPSNHRIYFDYGSATLDSLYKPYQLVVDSLMRNKGYTETNSITREYPGEDHTESAWARRLNVPLEFLLGKH